MIGWSSLPVIPTGIRPNSSWKLLDKGEMAPRSVDPPTPAGFENGEFIWKYDVEHLNGNFIIHINFFFLSAIKRYIGKRHEYKLPADSMIVALNREELIKRLPTAPQQPFDGYLANTGIQAVFLFIYSYFMSLTALL